MGETTDEFKAYSLERLGAGTVVGINAAELASGGIEKPGAVSAHAETSAPDAAPTITGLSPDICAGGTITITGTNLYEPKSVRIGGIEVSSIVSYTPTEIVARVNDPCTGTVSVTTDGGKATSTAIFTANAIPPAPTVVSPVNYCLNQVALPLTATGAAGSTLLWGSGSLISGTAGGTDILPNNTYIDDPHNNKKTIFTTNVPNVTITTIDYYVAEYQQATNFQLAIYNSQGAVIATSSTVTSVKDRPVAVKISNRFNYTITTRGTYSVGLVPFSSDITRTGNIGFDNPSFPITEPTGTISITGITPTYGGRCYNNIQFTVDNNSTTAPTPVTSVAGSTDYHVSQSVNGCVSPQAIIQVVVAPVSIGGTVSSGATVCSGTNSGILKLTGHTGSVIRWEKSINGGSTWTPIANTTILQPYSNITQTTQYRAVVQQGSCSSANSTAATITVSPVSVGGTVGSSATVCTGTNSGTLNLTGNTGSVIRWEYSFNGGTLWAPIANTTTSQSYSNLTQTTQYRAVVQNGDCSSANSTAAIITVTPAPSATIFYASSPLCWGGGLALVTQTGTTGGVYTAPQSLSIDAITGTINAFKSSIGTYTVTYSIKAGVCAAYSTTTKVTVVAPGQWSGVVSSNWNDGRNWLCGQIPTVAMDVHVPAGSKYYPILTSGGAHARNIIIDAGGTLTVSGDTLQIFGAITNKGVFDVSNGTIDMRGITPQTIPVGAFANNRIKNLIISNTSSGTGANFKGVKVEGNIGIYQSLTFGASGATLNTGGFITLKSNAIETAWMGNINGGAIIGDVTVERYVTALKNWQLLAVPTNTSQTIHQAWQENQAPGVVGTVGFGTNITGPSGTGFDFISPNYSMKYWDNAAGVYKMITNTGGQFPNSTSGNGFFLYIRGDRRANASDTTPHEPTVLRSKGPLYTGAQEFKIPAKYYYSIGNPYASKVDFGNITGMSSIGSLFYLWDAMISGSYGAGGYQTLSEANGYKPLIPTAFYDPSVPCPYLESGQAAFVYNNSPSPVTLTFNENDKRDSSNLVYYVGVDISSSQFFRTYLSTASGTIADGNAVAFNKDYQDGLDMNDAVKFFNTGENFSLKRNGVILSVEARSPVKASDTLFYDMEYVTATNYQLQFKPENMPDTLIAFLVDNYLKTKTEISLKENSAVNFTVNSDAASSATNRFMVVFEENDALPVTFVSIKATEKDKNILVDWQVASEDNMQQYEVEKSTDGNNFEKVATVAAKNDGAENYQWIDENATSGYNYYRVRGVGKDNNSQYTTVEKVLMGDLKAAIIVYPNPVTGEMIHLQFKNQPKGEYNTRLFNHLGQLVVAKKIEFAGGNGNADIHWNSNLSRGMYQLEVTKPDGTVVSIKIMY